MSFNSTMLSEKSLKKYEYLNIDFYSWDFATIRSENFKLSVFSIKKKFEDLTQLFAQVLQNFKANNTLFTTMREFRQTFER